jgi:single-stranded DNA-binding protein
MQLVQRDSNDWKGSGVIIDEPKMITLRNGQKLLSFTFLVTEHFTTGSGAPGRHENYFTIEALGRQAETYYRELIVGVRYQVKGYLRADNLNGVDRVRVRAFTILTDVVNGG